jgi:hypothetical protein
LLNNNGILFIEVPWIEAKDASPHNIYFKAHINYFSVDTLIASASKYFDVVKSDTSSNLRVLFKVKPKPEYLRLPCLESVEKLEMRLSQKGWREYLFNGAAVQKFINKISRIVEEQKVPSITPKDILDDLLEKETAKRVKAAPNMHDK